MPPRECSGGYAKNDTSLSGNRSYPAIATAILGGIQVSGMAMSALEKRGISCRRWGDSNCPLVCVLGTAVVNLGPSVVLNKEIG